MFASVIYARGKLTTGIADTGGKFTAGVTVDLGKDVTTCEDTGGQFAAGVNKTGGAP